MKKTVLICFIGLFTALGAHAQFFRFEASNGPGVIQNGYSLKYPWAGGLAAPQFGEMDVNGDGLKDVLVFERTDDVLQVWLRRVENGQQRFEFAPAFATLFPPMRSWFQLIDFNQDGRVDLFTSANGGAMVYQNIGSVGQPQFVLRSALLDAWWEFGFRASILVMNMDKPGIADFDGDGDLDMAAFDNFDIGKINYYRNMSVERYGNADSLDFVVRSRCWGLFEEDQLSSNIRMNLGANCFPLTPMPNVLARVQHMGSTITPINANRDSLMDILLGDVEGTTLKYLRNGGTRDTAKIVQALPSFPSYDTSISIPIFPAAYPIDVDNDGRQDLIVAPNDAYQSTLTNHVWYFRNASTTQEDSFRLQKRAFLVEDILQYYTNAAPLVTDIDHDGKADLLVAFENGAQQGVLHFYKNVGTLGEHLFQLVDTAFLRLDTLDLRFPRLAAGDLNGDGYSDLLIGTMIGELLHYQHSAQPNVTSFQLITKDFQQLNAGFGLAPELGDVNRDGKLDLLLGTREGRVRYYTNTGTASNPSFTLTNTEFGQIHVAEFFTGFAVPRLSDFNRNGNYDLVVGTERGRLYFYPDFEGNTGRFPARNIAIFHPQTGLYDSTRLSYYITPCVMMMNNDTFPDLLVGTYRGGVRAFVNNQQNVSVRELAQEAQIRVFPNPSADGLFNLYKPAEKQGGWKSVSIYDLQGRLLERLTLEDLSNQTSIRLQSQGMLLLRIEFTDGSSNHQRVLVLR
ncbi:MAG: hypothetical protein C0424_02895 [Sphingobacteriaceae bacterium]|nr:hypothetical protein [Sphingobacteriaceae bacterium]